MMSSGFPLLQFFAMRRRTFLSLAAAAPVGLRGQNTVLAEAKRRVRLGTVTAHVQGIDTDGAHLWVTAVDRPGAKGFLYRFSLPDGALEQVVEVGLDQDRKSVV